MKGERGSTLDVSVMVLGIVVFVVCALVGNLMMNEYYAQAQQIPVMANSNVTMSILYEGVWYYENTADNIAVAIFMGANIAAAVLAFIFGQNPIFKGFLLIVNMLYIVFAGVFQLWWENYGSNAAFASVIVNLPKANYILSNLAIFALVGVAIITLALFAKSKQENPYAS